MTNPWPPYDLSRLKAYVLAPGVVQIGEIITPFQKIARNRLHLPLITLNSLYR